MLEQILDLVKQYGQQSVVENNQVPNQNNNAIMAEAASTITSGLQNVISGGGLNSIISMFSGRQQQNNGSILSNPIVSMMIGHLASKLVSKMNLSPAVANGISANIIPGVLASMVSKTTSNAPENDGFDLNDLVAMFTGGDTAADNRQTHGIDLQDILGQLAGGGSQQPDLTSVINSVTQRAQNQQPASQGGSITDIIGGFFR